MKQGILVSSIILNLLLAGCSGRSAEPTSAVAVTMEDYTGRAVSDYFAAGPYNLVVLNYWTTFCAPCKKEMMDLTALYENYRDRGVLVLGAATDEADQKTLVEKIAASLGVTYPILYGTEAVFQGEEVLGYPTTFFIRDGRVVEKVDGARDYDFFAAMVEHHLALLPETPTLEDVFSASPRYHLSYRVTNRAEGRVLALELGPAEGYYLNGPGYPPLSVKIEPYDGLAVQPAEHILEGIALGEREVLEFSLSGNLEEAATLKCTLSLIACDSSTCSMIEDALDIEL